MPDNVKAYECIQSSDNIIHHDADASMNILVEPGNWKWFSNVEYSEKNKTKNPGKGMTWCESEGDKHPQDFIYNNGTRIRGVEDFFS